MRLKVLTSTLIAMFLLANKVTAQEKLLSNFTPEQAIYIMRLGNAYGTARFCNYGIGLSATRAAALNAFGADTKISAERAMDILMIVDGLAAASEDTIFAGRWTPKEKQKKCTEMLKFFGPDGTLIRGAVEP